MSEDRHRLMRVSHPILHLEVIGPDGRRTSEHRVFCRYQRRSVPVGTCCACTHCDAIVGGPFPSVDCTISLDEDARSPDPRGVRTAVGAVLEKGTVALDPATSIREALSLLRSEDRRSVAVVDGESHTMVGVVHEATFVASEICRTKRRSEEEVLRVMSGNVAIHESVPVRKALEILAAAHLREATVVDDAGVPIGVFRDVDGLRWLVFARDESASTEDCPARS